MLGLIALDADRTPDQLAHDIGVTKGAVSQHLAVPEEQGYIRRTRSDHDRRVQVHTPGKRCEAYRDSIEDHERYTVDRYLTGLTVEELNEIVQALTTLKRAFDD